MTTANAAATLYALLCADERRTVRELQAAAGLSSTSVTAYWLRKLRADGLVEWDASKARSFRVVHHEAPSLSAGAMEDGGRV